jgi:hypothetical protein
VRSTGPIFRMTSSRQAAPPPAQVVREGRDVVGTLLHRPVRDPVQLEVDAGFVGRPRMQGGDGVGTHGTPPPKRDGASVPCGTLVPSLWCRKALSGARQALGSSGVPRSRSHSSFAAARVEAKKVRADAQAMWEAGQKVDESSNSGQGPC